MQSLLILFAVGSMVFAVALATWSIVQLVQRRQRQWQAQVLREHPEILEIAMSSWRR